MAKFICEFVLYSTWLFSLRVPLFPIAVYYIFMVSLQFISWQKCWNYFLVPLQNRTVQFNSCLDSLLPFLFFTHTQFKVVIFQETSLANLSEMVTCLYSKALLVAILSFYFMFQIMVLKEAKKWSLVLSYSLIKELLAKFTSCFCVNILLD